METIKGEEIKAKFIFLVLNWLGLTLGEEKREKKSKEEEEKEEEGGEEEDQGMFVLKLSVFCCLGLLV